MAQAQSTRQTTPSPPEKRRVTLDEYYRLLDTAGYEVIDGELIPMAPQHRRGTYIARALFLSLHGAVERQLLGDVLPETAFSLDIESGTNWVTGSVVPDIAFVSAARLKEQEEKYPSDAPFRVAPDLAVEIISPTDSFSDVTRKVARYLGYGVKLVWVVDPKNRRVHVYSTENPDGHILSETETLSAEGIIPGWSIPVSEVFSKRL